MKMIPIIIPTWDLLEYTKKAVASIRTKHPYTIIIVDDGSTDGTVEWAKEQSYVIVKARPPTVFDPSKLNYGLVGYKYNLGVRKAIELGYDQAVIAHNDILFHKDALDNLISLYEKLRSQGYVLITGAPAEHVHYNPEAAKFRGLETTMEDLDALAPIDFLSREDTFLLTFFIIGKEAFERVGEFDDVFTFCEFISGDYVWRMEVAGVNYAVSKLAWHYHYGGRTWRTWEQAQSHELMMKSWSADSDRYLKKWGCPDPRPHPWRMKEKYTRPFNQ